MLMPDTDNRARYFIYNFLTVFSFDYHFTHK